MKRLLLSRHDRDREKLQTGQSCTLLQKKIASKLGFKKYLQMTVGQWPKDDKQTIYSTFIVLKIESLALLEIIRGLTYKPAI